MYCTASSARASSIAPRRPATEAVLTTNGCHGLDPPALPLAGEGRSLSISVYHALLSRSKTSQRLDDDDGRRKGAAGRSNCM